MSQEVVWLTRRATVFHTREACGRRPGAKRFPTLRGAAEAQGFTVCAQCALSDAVERRRRIVRVLRDEGLTYRAIMKRLHMGGIDCDKKTLEMDALRYQEAS